MSSISAIYTTGGRDKYRAHSFYPTESAATVALMNAERDTMPPGKVYDGACGDGAILKVVAGYGRAVVGTDLVDRGYGRGGVDFLTRRRLPADILIMNPPYDDGLDEAFILHALSLRPAYAAFLVKWTFFHCQSRWKITDACAPARVYPLSWRIDFTGKKKPHMGSSWIVFTPRSPTPANDTRLMRALPHPFKHNQKRERS